MRSRPTPASWNKSPSTFFMADFKTAKSGVTYGIRTYWVSSLFCSHFSLKASSSSSSSFAFRSFSAISSSSYFSAQRLSYSSACFYANLCFPSLWAMKEWWFFVMERNKMMWQL
jgi:hypothetical protein